jgi:hypothetical protein
MQLHGCDEMRLDIADAGACDPGIADDIHDLAMFSHGDSRQGFKRFDDHGSLPQIAQRNLARNEGMRKHTAIIQKPGQMRVARPQVIDPHRGIDEDHPSAGLRRGAASSPGSLPPSRARRRALSRSIRAFRPSRTRVDFSCTPVRLLALARRVSSIARVVRMN